MSFTDTRLPAALEAAVAHVQGTAQAVAERVAAGLGVQAQAATRILERDLLLATQIELRRKINAFQQTFARVLRDKVQEDVAPRLSGLRRQAATDWQSLSLVDDHEVEERMFSDRIAQQISHACEWELRDLAAYMGAVLNLGRPDEERNPVRPEVVGMAVFRAVEATTNDPDSRKLLAREFGVAMSGAMAECYRGIVADMQARKVQPAGLALKTVHGPGQSANSGYSSLRDTLGSTRTAAGELGTTRSDLAGLHGMASGGASSGFAATAQEWAATRASATGVSPFAATRAGAGLHAAPAAPDAPLMDLLRRLTFLASRPGAVEASGGGAGLADDAGMASFGQAGADAGAMTGAMPGAMPGAPAGGGAVDGAVGGVAPGLMAVNLIRAHRDELVQASPGKLDHMVIDVVGSLFDQILSDPKVPPQMARQIARLQLPVLRVALADASFFSSRRHPVRRFVNRIASLACAFEEFDDGPGREFLDRVKALVQEIVEGDFDQVELYASKLTALETFIATQTETGARHSGAVSVLESKESELRVQQRYMTQLSAALADVAMPDYLRDFVAQVWSQAIVGAVRRHGADSEHARRFRLAGRDLVMSVQPKGAPLLRKRFLMQLPGLMRDLNEGLQLIGWPEAAQKSFFGQLLPAHAESLKAPPLSELEHNLLAKQLEGVFNAPIPGPQDVLRAPPVELPEAELAQRFTPDEARQVGLVDEAAVDWSGPVDIDLGAEAGDTVPSTEMAAEDDAPAGPRTAVEAALDIDLDIAHADPANPAEPVQGAALVDHIRLGFAYQMLLKDQWQKVRLTYVSPGRSFFVFTRGRKHQETISLSSRMLARMCEGRRLRAFEQAYLMERATARARRQLAALKSAPAGDRRRDPAPLRR